jgi:hypothetical protein
MSHRIIALLLGAAAITFIQHHPVIAQSAQEFMAQEASGQFAATKSRQRLQRTQRVTSQQQNQASEFNVFSPDHAQQPQRRAPRQQTNRGTEVSVFGGVNDEQQPPQRRQPRQALNQPTEVNLFGGLGGSWLASNMGAPRPAGAPGLWCGYAMRMEMQSAGYGDPGPSFNLVSNWCRLGTPAPVGAIGSIFVSRGHVSKVVAGDCPAGTVATISGNATGRRVSHMCEPISRAVCSRWPGSAVTQLTR